MAARHSRARGWSTSSNRVLSDWTMRGPSDTRLSPLDGISAAHEGAAGLHKVTPAPDRSCRGGGDGKAAGEHGLGPAVELGQLLAARDAELPEDVRQVP